MTKHAGMRESGYIEHDRAPARSARWSKAESSGTAQEMKQSESSGTAQEMKQSAIELHTASSNKHVYKEDAHGRIF